MESVAASTRAKRIIIDTDAGVDDALAMLLALLSPHECKIEAITTVCGNVNVDQATDNVLRILELYQRACSKSKSTTHISHPLPQVFKGEPKPLTRKYVDRCHICSWR